jgi:hypothetical protein
MSVPESGIIEIAAAPNYTIEDDVNGRRDGKLLIQRKSNSQRKDKPWMHFW